MRGEKSYPGGQLFIEDLRQKAESRCRRGVENVQDVEDVQSVKQFEQLEQFEQLFSTAGASQL